MRRRFLNIFPCSVTIYSNSVFCFICLFRFIFPLSEICKIIKTEIEIFQHKKIIRNFLFFPHERQRHQKYVNEHLITRTCIRIYELYFRSNHNCEIFIVLMRNFSVKKYDIVSTSFYACKEYYCKSIRIVMDILAILRFS